MWQPVSRAGEGRKQQVLDRAWKQQCVQVAWEVGVGWEHWGWGVTAGKGWGGTALHLGTQRALGCCQKWLPWLPSPLGLSSSSEGGNFNLLWILKSLLFLTFTEDASHTRSGSPSLEGEGSLARPKCPRSSPALSCHCCHPLRFVPSLISAPWQFPSKWISQPR